MPDIEPRPLSTYRPTTGQPRLKSSFDADAVVMPMVLRDGEVIEPEPFVPSGARAPLPDLPRRRGKGHNRDWNPYHAGDRKRKTPAPKPKAKPRELNAAPGRAMANPSVFASTSKDDLKPPWED